MAGIDLNLDLPDLSLTLTENVTRIATGLAAIEDTLADRVTPSGLDMNATLSLEGNAITNVRGLHLTDGYDELAAGTLYMSSDELYVHTAAGSVRLTLAGSLDAAALGGITGLGGTTASVVFDNASDEFRFFSDSGVYADVVADDVVLQGANGTVRLGVDAAINSARVINVKSLPATGVGLLAYDAANTALVDASATGISKDHSFSGTITFSAATFNAAPKHAYSTSIVLFAGMFWHDTTKVGRVAGESLYCTSTTGGNPYVDIRVPTFPGMRIGSALINIGQPTGTGSTVQFRRVNSGGDTVLQTFSASTDGYNTFTVTSPETAGVATYYYFRVFFGAATHTVGESYIYYTVA